MPEPISDLTSDVASQTAVQIAMVEEDTLWGEATRKVALDYEQALPRYDLNPPPIYPEPARRRGQSGVVLLTVFVLMDGRVGELTVHHSSGYKSLDMAAMKAVRFWQFKPALSHGSPIESRVIVPVAFVLEN